MARVASVSDPTANFMRAGLNGIRKQKETAKQRKRRLEKARQKYQKKQADENDQAKCRRAEDWQQYKDKESSEQHQARLKHVRNSMAQSRAIDKKYFK